MRGKNDESPLGQTRAERLVIFVTFASRIFIDHISRQTFKAMLAHHHWPALAGFDLLGDQ